MLRQIRYFLAVADCGSFTEAAERCFISQSAISQQIAALEKELGVELIRRGRRSFTLTPAGEYLYRQGRTLVELAEELRRETVRIGGGEEAQLRIGYLECVSKRMNVQVRADLAAIQGSFPQACRGKSRKTNAEVQPKTPKMRVQDFRNTL